jgi:hypothetical protein
METTLAALPIGLVIVTMVLLANVGRATASPLVRFSHAASRTQGQACGRFKAPLARGPWIRVRAQHASRGPGTSLRMSRTASTSDTAPRGSDICKQCLRLRLRVGTAALSL